MLYQIWSKIVNQGLEEFKTNDPYFLSKFRDTIILFKRVERRLYINIFCSVYKSVYSAGIIAPILRRFCPGL